MAWISPLMAVLYFVWYEGVGGQHMQLEEWEGCPKGDDGHCKAIRCCISLTFHWHLLTFSLSFSLSCHEPFTGLSLLFLRPLTALSPALH